jgi:putative membrane protein
MNVISQVIAGLTALALIGIGVLEIFFHSDRRFYRLFLIEPHDVPAVRMWAMNIGAYNITFALGMLLGLWLIDGADAAVAGTAIVIFCCVAQFLLGIWLWATEKRLWLSAIGQALFPGLVVAFWLLLY